VKNFRRIRNIHLIGIGGVGMGGIAEVLLNLGYQVSGSDPKDSALVQRLKSLGVKVFSEHKAENIVGSDVIVASAAVPADNVEISAARHHRIPIIPRAQMLAELMRFKQGIAIAGTHGKTTTTSLVASLMAEAGLDPTFVIGGKLNSAGTNARLGEGRYFVAEACESDASFLHLTPMIAVVTNIDRDHLETYNDDFSRLKLAFLEFLHRLPFYGLAVLCADDAEIRSVLPEVARPVLTYGFSEDADYQVVDFKPAVGHSTFNVRRPNHQALLSISLNIPGRHNALNALAAITIATEEGLPDAAIQKGLAQFQGIGRRFQILAEIDTKDGGQALVIDDYGHHPREVQVVVETIRESWPSRRLVMVYQPHRYTRTKSLFEDFSSVLSEVDVLLLLEVYSAGEEPILGADSRHLCASIRIRGRVDPIFIPQKSSLNETLANVCQADDIILMQGAGDIGSLAQDIAQMGLIGDKHRE
jgi:UDP-N-acetylmuramate--alanine ligase